MSARDTAFTVARVVGKGIGEALAIFLHVAIFTFVIVGIATVFGLAIDVRLTAWTVLLTMVLLNLKRSLMEFAVEHYPRTRVPQ